MERRIQGEEVSEAQLDKWIAEAEKGYDPAWLQKRMGRPTRADRPRRLCQFDSPKPN